MSCAILIPTYKRKSFETLITHNIRCQTYPCITMVIVADDSEDNLSLTVPYPVTYIKCTRMSIGEKRNLLKSYATTQYCAHMDTDDMYHPDYISNSIFNLVMHQKQLSGSADMLLTNMEFLYVQRCMYLNLLNEATMVYTKEYGNTHFFEPTMSSEGKLFCDKRDIWETDIATIMVCYCHKENTVSKEAWLTHKVSMPMVVYKPHLTIIASMK